MMFEMPGDGDAVGEASMMMILVTTDVSLCLRNELCPKLHSNCSSTHFDVCNRNCKINTQKRVLKGKVTFVYSDETFRLSCSCGKKTLKDHCNALNLLHIFLINCKGLLS